MPSPQEAVAAAPLTADERWRPRSRSIGLRATIAGALLTAGLTPLIAILAIYLLVLEPRLEREVLKEREQLALEMGSVLNRNLFERYGDVQAFAMNASAANPAAWRTPGAGPLVRAMDSYVRLYGAYRITFLASPTGEILAVNSRDSQGRPIDTAALYGRSVAGEPWFERARAGQTSVAPAQSSPFVDRLYADRALVVPFSAPVRDASGRLVGVWVNLFDLHEVGAIAQDMVDQRQRVQPSDQRFQVIAAGGEVIYDSRPAISGPREAEVLRRYGTRTVGPPVSGVVGDETVAAAAAPPRSGLPGLGWTTLVREPVSVTFAALEAIRGIVIGALVLTALVMLALGLWYGEQLSQPILQLADRMRRLAAGDTASPVAFTDRPDDIGHMAEAVAVFREAAIEKHLATTRRALAMEAADIGAWEFEPATGAVTFDARTREIFALTADEDMNYEVFLSLVAEEDRARVDGLVGQAIDPTGSGEYHAEYRVIGRSDGRLRWVSAIGKALFEDGHTRRMIGTLIDITARRLAEEILRESETRRVLAMDAADIGSWELHLPSRILTADGKDQVFRYGDIARTGVPFADWLNNVAPEDRTRVAAAVDDALDPSGDGIYDIEYRAIGPGDLPERWMISKGKAFFENGTAVRFLGTAMNVTERKRAETALRESEARRSLAMEAADIGAWELDLGAGILRGDPRVWRLVGFEVPAQGIPIAEFRNLVHPDDRPLYEELVAQALDPTGEGYYQHEYRVVPPGGLSEQWLLVRGRAFFEDGKAVRFFGTTMNVTERRRAEAELRESEARRSLAMEAADIGAWDMDPRSGMLRGDPRTWRLAQIEEHPDGMPLTEWMDLVHPDDREIVEAGVAQALDPAGDGTYHQEYRVIVPGPAEVWLAIQGKAFFENGAAVRFLGTTMNVTERKRAELYRELLVNELNHRVKNSLATAQALAMLTFAANEDPQVAKANFMTRIAALARAHDVLTRHSWEGAEMAEVIQSALTPFASDRIAARGPCVRLWPKAALAFSSSLFELATNAAKHGALSNETGRVAISWRLVGDDFRLSWQESGGPPVAAPHHRGFGVRLIQQGLAGELGAKVDLDFAPEGLIFTIGASRVDLQGPDE